jgi:hypothetical protein
MRCRRSVGASAEQDHDRPYQHLEAGPEGAWQRYLSSTAIASFRDGVYQNDHAAIFVSQDDKGITVYDQYNHPKKAWGKRVLRFDLKPKGDYSNDGEYFYTITTK